MQERPSAGSEGGAWAAGVLFSIVRSCELAGIDPFEYLRDILRLLPNAKPVDLAALTPRAWAERFGEKACEGPPYVTTVGTAKLATPGAPKLTAVGAAKLAVPGHPS